MSQRLITVIPELDNASIRRTSDGRCSVYDLIEVAGGNKNPRQAWNDLKKQFPEVVQKTDNFKFPGKGQRQTPVTNREGWAYILGVLPGVIGRSYREESVALVIRYLDADVTLAESIVERTEDEKGLERLEARIKGKKIRNEHTRTLKARGVHSNLHYAICTNNTYAGLYGTNADGLRKRKNLAPKTNVREHMSTDELIEVGFSENLSTRRIKQGTAQGFKECSRINYKTAKSVSEFICDTLAS